MSNEFPSQGNIPINEEDVIEALREKGNEDPEAHALLMKWVKKLRMSLLFKNFQGYPDLVYGMSEKKDGSMKLFGDAEKDKPARERREQYFSWLGITLGRLVSASLVHGVRVQTVTKKEVGSIIPETDGLITSAPDIFLTVTGADCFPVYFYEPTVKVVGLIHVGWRGLVGGIVSEAISKLVEKFSVEPRSVLVGIGPGIRECHFEIKLENKELYKDYPDCISERKGRVFIDLSGIMIKQLRESGVEDENIEDSGLCTYCNEKEYFSYRRDKPAVLETMIAYIGLK